MLFSELQKIMVNKATCVDLKGTIVPIAPPGPAPCVTMICISAVCMRAVGGVRSKLPGGKWLSKAKQAAKKVKSFDIFAKVLHEQWRIMETMKIFPISRVTLFLDPHFYKNLPWDLCFHFLHLRMGVADAFFPRPYYPPAAAACAFSALRMNVLVL